VAISADWWPEPLKFGFPLPILQGEGGRHAMSITEIAATGLLRTMVPAATDASRSELPESAARAIALAALDATVGSHAATLQLPRQAAAPPPRTTGGRLSKRPAAQSGDYRAQARGRRGRPARDSDGEAASTFSGLV
jgi:hypothetical protein